MVSRVLLKRRVGFLLTVVGVLLFYFLVPIAADSGSFIITLVVVCLIVGVTGFGGSLFMNLGVRYSLKTLALVFAFGIPWCTLFYVLFPYDSGLLALSVAGIVVFLIRRHHKKNDEKSQQKA